MKIRKLLVANRGEIAVRIFATAERMGISTVAVFSDPDRHALFTSCADEAVSLGGASPADSYLRGDAIIDAARAVGADAVHPGYGFLSENADFARSVIAAGLVWVGPPPDAIDVMGSKLASKELVSAAGIPTLVGATVTDTMSDDVGEAAESIGFPVLVKASAGGGGKGMRIVTDPGDLLESIASARREAGSAFGDDTLFIERYVEAPRHIEIQVFADHLGATFSLFERECSIQRRHQKIIEESPSPALDDATRQAMGLAATEAAAAVGYRGAGTVEFLFKDGEFWFLEMNTRLQVEHPVTEMVTGLDLVELQLLTAAGEDLPPGVADASITGHAVEARLYAEDPTNDYLPVTGEIVRFDIPAFVRTDTGVADGSVVSVHYDPMLAKVIAHGPDRTTAIAALARALRGATIAGITTNRNLLVGILEHPEFVAGEIDTHFLERHPAAELDRPLLAGPELRDAAIVAALDASMRRRATAGVLRTLPSGWRNNRSAKQSVSFVTPTGSGPSDVRYVAQGGDRFIVEIDGEDVAVRYTHSDPSRLEIDGHLTHPSITWSGDVAHVVLLGGAVDLMLLPRFAPVGLDVDPGNLTSPMPGKILEVLVSEGSPVVRGDSLIVMEAMKMEHTLRAPTDGTVVSVSVRAGDQVDGGMVLAVVEAAEESE